VDHMQDQAVLVPLTVDLIQVVPHRRLQGEWCVVMEIYTVEARVVLQRPESESL